MPQIPKNISPRLWFPLFMVGFAVVGGLYVFQPWRAEGPAASATGPAASATGPVASATVTENAPSLTAAAVLGDPNAPVTVIDYSDFQCSICKGFVMRLKPDFIKTFVEPGLVRLEFRHYIRFGDESMLAAQAAECANEQGSFWEYHQTLYDHQRGKYQGIFVRDNLVGFAKSLGLDTAAFEACFDSRRYLEKVQAHTDEGRAGGAGHAQLRDQRAPGGQHPLA